MYLTAQRVASPVSGKEGVNVFLYRHDQAVQTAGSDVSWLHWDKPDLAKIVDEFPGNLTSSNIEVPPGGNSVLDYLDVVAPDATDERILAGSLKQFEREWAQDRFDEVIRLGSVAIRFNAAHPRRDTAPAEIRELSDRVIKLLRQPVAPSWEAADPLRIFVTDEKNAQTYFLDSEAIARLRAVHGPSWEPSRVSVSHEARVAEVGDAPEVYGHIAAVLTGLPIESLAPLGGVRFIADNSEEVLWAWPSSVVGTGYCLSCHRHRTLKVRPNEGGYRCSHCNNLQSTDGLWVATLP